MKRLLSLATIILVVSFHSLCQVVTTQPAMVQTDSENIVITYHADQGNAGLAGLSASSAVYAHTGVITSESTSSSDWKHAPTWLDNAAKYKMTYAGPNTWTLTIPSIATYYNLNQGEVVKELMFVFRDATGSREGKTAQGGDIAVKVYPAGFQMEIDAPIVVTDSNPVTLTVNTTKPADILLYVEGSRNSPIASVVNATQLTAQYSFTTVGDSHIIAEATATQGGQVIQSTANVVRADASAPQVNYPGGTPKMGPVANADGSITFCLAAPGKKTVFLVGSWSDYTLSQSGQMNRQDFEGNSYFWLTVPATALAGKTDFIYYFLVDGAIAVGDPYARLVLNPWDDKYIPSSVYPNLPQYPYGQVPDGTMLAYYSRNIDNYNWQVTDFKGVAQSDLLVYELLIRDFTGTEGQSLGNGTVQGVIDKLDYLESLHINAIELMPIMEFDGNNSWGYNTNFYFAPDKAYGTPNDYRRLIDECHRRGIAVILDIVFNQTAGNHPWYRMYNIDVNPFYNGSAPHCYSVLNDWNQDNPIVQQQFKDALRYWLSAYKVDGFRFDLVKGLGDNSSYGTTYYPATNTFAEPQYEGTERYNATRIARMKSLHSAMKEVNPNAYFINENLARAEEENAMATDGEINWANVNGNACNYAAGKTPGSQTVCSLERFYAPKDDRTWGSTVSYAESHDEERVAFVQARDGVATIKNNQALAMRRLGSLAAQMILMPGAHMIWQFEELGADQTTKDGSNNDTSPKRVIWSYLNDANRVGLHQDYTDLLGIRASNPEMFREDVTTTLSGLNWSSYSSPGYLRLTKGDKELLLLVYSYISTSTSPRNLTIKSYLSFDPSNYKLLAASHGTSPSLSATGSIGMMSCGYAVFGTNNLAGIDDVATDAINKVEVTTTPDGSILIVGDYHSAAVYNVAGMKVGFDRLPKGVYVVNVDGRSFKVAVR